MLRAGERSSRLFASLHLPQHVAQNGFLGLGRGAIGRIGLGEGQLERPLGIAGQPGVADELTRRADRPESLVVKIIRQPVRSAATVTSRARGELHRPERSRMTRSNRLPRKCRGPIRMIEPSQGLEREGRSCDRHRRAVEDREVLGRQGMPVFETAVLDAAAGEVPAPADQLDGFERARRSRFVSL